MMKYIENLSRGEDKSKVIAKIGARIDEKDINQNHAATANSHQPVDTA